MQGKKLASLIARANKTLAGVEQSTIDRIDAILQGSYVEIEAKLNSAYPEALISYRASREIAQLFDFGNLLKLINPSNEAQIQSDLTDLVTRASGQGVAGATELLNGYEVKTPLHFTVPIESVKFIATDSFNRLKLHGDQFAVKGTQIIGQGLAQGQGVRRVASQLRAELGITKGRAETIARTSSIQAYDSATRETYRSVDVEGVIRVATQDARLCSRCAARAGNAYKLDEAPAAIHPNDRCYNAPFKKSWVELGLIDSDWFKNHAAECRGKVESLDYSKAPFENSVPKPIWTPR